MIDAMENISSQKETANNKYVAQHIECPSKSQHVTKNLGQVGRAKCNIHRFLKIPSCTYSYISRSILEEDLDLLFFFSNPSKLMSSFSSFGGTWNKKRVDFSNPLFSPAPSSCTLLKSSSNHRRHRGPIQQPAKWRSGPRSARRASWSGRCSPGWKGLAAREPKAPEAAHVNDVKSRSNHPHLKRDVTQICWL